MFHRAFGGGAGEVSQVVGAMTSLQKIAGERDFLLIGDSKLISYGNVTAMNAAGVAFIAPLAASRVPAGLWAGLDVRAAQPVGYVAARDAGKPPGQRCAYRVSEDTMDLAGPRKSDPVAHLRRVLVHSTANAAAAASARALKLERARTELDTLVRAAGGRYQPDAAAITARISQITRKHRIAACLRTQITTSTLTGKPSLAWHYDQKTLAGRAATDGWYALLTNTSPASTSTADVLIRYKGQPHAGRRYSDFKGPGFPSNRGDFGCGDHGPGRGCPCCARAWPGQAGACPLFLLPGAAGVPGVKGGPQGRRAPARCAAPLRAGWRPRTLSGRSKDSGGEAASLERPAQRARRAHAASFPVRDRS